MQRIITLIFIMTALGCSSNDRDIILHSNNLTFPVKPLSIDTDQDGMGANLRLSYTHTSDNDTSAVYDINSTFENKNIGFIISIPKKGFAKLSIRRNGKNSDNFIHALQRLYKLKVDSTAKFVDLIAADCILIADYVDSLNKKENGKYIITEESKLFFQGKTQDDYAELYLNINKTEHWIELKEKDEEYRPIIIRLLTKR